MKDTEIKDGGQSTWEQEIRAAEEEGRRAFLDRDIERLDAAWFDDFVVNSPINRVIEKDLTLQLLRAGTIAHATLEADIETMMRHENIVIVMGSEVVRNKPDGPIIRRRFTNVWLATDGNWRLLARHANVIADQA